MLHLTPSSGTGTNSRLTPIVEGATHNLVEEKTAPDSDNYTLNVVHEFRSLQVLDGPTKAGPKEGARRRGSTLSTSSSSGSLRSLLDPEFGGDHAEAGCNPSRVAISSLQPRPNNTGLGLSLSSSDNYCHAPHFTIMQSVKVKCSFLLFLSVT